MNFHGGIFFLQCLLSHSPEDDLAACGCEIQQEGEEKKKKKKKKAQAEATEEATSDALIPFM